MPLVISPEAGLTGDPVKTHRSFVIFGYGNPSRGDDALGPELLRRLNQRRQQLSCGEELEFLSDFQLQIEHALDLVGRKLVLFVDASLTVKAPCSLSRVEPERDDSFTTHALTPSAILHVYGQLQLQPPPPCYLLAIRGYRFELGEPMSAAAQTNLDQSLVLVEEFLARHGAGQMLEFKT